MMRGLLLLSALLASLFALAGCHCAPGWDCQIPNLSADNRPGGDGGNGGGAAGGGASGGGSASSGGCP